MKICITGASGFIGQKLVLALCQQGHTITVLSRSKDRVFPDGTRVIIGDLADENCELDQFLDKCDVFFHCAGELHQLDTMKALHIGGTQRLLQAVYKQNKQRITPLHWVQLSSVGVYGPTQGGANKDRVIMEDSSLAPKGEYEITKAGSDELVIHAAADNVMTYSIVRPSNVYGKNMPNNTLRLLINAVRKGVFFYIGKKGAVAPYIHVDDVVNVLIQCGINQQAKGEVFNVSYDCYLEDMITEIAVELGVSKPWLRLPEVFVRSAVLAMKWAKLPFTKNGINALVSRTKYPTFKLEQRLGIKPNISVASKLDELIVRK